MTMLMGLAWGILGTFFLMMFIGGIIFVGYLLNRQIYNRQIRIKNWTAGKPYVEVYWGRVEKHKTLGDVYYIPKLKNQERHYIPYFGGKYEYGTNKGKIFYVPLSFYNGSYSPEQYDPYHIEEKETIYKTESGEWVKGMQKIQTFITKPVKASISQFVMEADTSIKDEFDIKPGWWEKYGGYVLTFIIVFAGAAVSIIFVIFGYKMGIDSSQIPAWAQHVLEKTVTAPPPAG